MPLPQYEHYMETFQILEWKDDCIYRTQSLGCSWVSGQVVLDNKPLESNILFVAANDEFAKNNVTIRRSKEARSDDV